MKVASKYEQFRLKSGPHFVDLRAKKCKKTWKTVCVKTLTTLNKSQKLLFNFQLPLTTDMWGKQKTKHSFVWFLWTKNYQQSRFFWKQNFSLAITTFQEILISDGTCKKSNWQHTRLHVIGWCFSSENARRWNLELPTFWSVATKRQDAIFAATEPECEQVLVVTKVPAWDGFLRLTTVKLPIFFLFLWHIYIPKCFATWQVRQNWCCARNVHMDRFFFSVGI